MVTMAHIVASNFIFKYITEAKIEYKHLGHQAAIKIAVSKMVFAEYIRINYPLPYNKIK